MKIETTDLSSGPQVTRSVTSQTGGNLTVFDDVNPTELNAEFTVPKTLRDYTDMSNGLSRYLERAQLIQTYTWLATDLVAVKATFDPWSYVINNAIIKERIRYFTSLSGRLHLRIIMNGTPFHYGFAMINYVPLVNLQHSTYFNKYFNSTIGFQVQNVELNPTLSTPQEMVINNYTDIETIPINGNALTSLSEMGRCNLYVISPLRSANVAVPDPITIQIYAWMDDVKLGVPTPELTMAVGPEAVGKGPISSVASNIASTVSSYTNVPILGRFAMATEIGAKAVGAIATLFGYSNPTLLNRYEMYKSQTAINYCQSIGRDSSKKLTFDPLNELSIDPSSVGFPNRDELSYAFLYKVPFYARVITWNVASAAGTLLAILPVTPGMSLQDRTAPPAITHYLTPMAMLAYNTSYWTGSIKYRFKVTASAFHKGRIQIRYDPNRSTATIPGYGESTSQTVIMDIGIDTEKEIIVDWSQPQMWQNTLMSKGLLNSTENSNATNNWPNAMPINCNGELIIEVLTDLTCPQLVAPAEIHVFVELCDNVRFSHYNDLALQKITVLGPDSDEVTGRSAANCVHMGGSSTYPQDLLKVTMGEDITSLRTLFKRATCIGISSTLVGARSNVTVLVNLLFPPRKSFLSTNQTVGLPAVIPYDFFREAYAAEKGSSRYKVVRHNANGVPINSVAFRTDNGNWAITNALSVQTYSSSNLLQYAKKKLNGWTQFNPDEGVYEVEVPDYNPKKFYINTAQKGDTLFPGGQPGSVQFVDQINGFTDTTAGQHNYEVYYSWGEDHSLLCYTGMPPIYQATTWSTTLTNTLPPI